ncbi:serine O-acetyltransferase EpsC [Sphingomonas abietis]|uniref:serine O-acetyltransferase n=1 Tax=Sphingomonas abietis TaxID=3012344 RepID=A0ABY7NRD4_9SPHN|nr:serine O-acetyltransferase EpsC [Sphingomonas abietis]WBO23747.1 serine acetyltransferase [Sphingomonas abietis]
MPSPWIEDEVAIPPGAPSWDIDALTGGLRQARDDWRRAHRRDVARERVGFPSRARLEAIIALLAGALFPLRLGPSTVNPENEDRFVAQTLDTVLVQLRWQITLELGYSQSAPSQGAIEQRAARISQAFAAQLPDLRRLLDQDVEAAYAGDPAARSVDEVLLCYPSVTALIHHRIAHALYELDVPIIARIIAEVAHSATAIDIHPGARIGKSFFVDHGSGVVIGETAIIGDRVRLYQAVTLGARSFPTEESGGLKKGLERHPIVEDDVVIYAGATILGRVTIGRGAVIGGNVWLTQSVPAGSIVHQASAESDRPGQGDLPSGHLNLAALAI